MSYQKGPGQTVVIALGGNALGNTPQEQLELVKNTASHIVDMVSEGVNVVVSLSLIHISARARPAA